MEQNIGIIGLGLMGGSLALAMNSWPGKKMLSGYDLNPETLNKAVERGAVDRACPSVEDLAVDSDLIFVAVPVRSVPGLLFRIESHLPSQAIVFDLASAREWILQAIGGLSRRIAYAGFHPMCGKSKGGFDQARKNLFQNAPVLITPEHPPHRIAETARRVSSFLGGRVFFCTHTTMIRPVP